MLPIVNPKPQALIVKRIPTDLHVLKFDHAKLLGAPVLICVVSLGEAADEPVPSGGFRVLCLQKVVWAKEKNMCRL